MSRLTARPAPALLAATPLALVARQPIGGRRLRRRRRVLRPQSQLTFEIRDLFLRVRDPLLGLGQLLSFAKTIAERRRCLPSGYRDEKHSP